MYPHSCNRLLILFTTIGILFAYSCTNDQLPESSLNLTCLSDDITFDNQIQPLIDTYCNLPECHNSGSSFGDYTSYQTMAGVLNDSDFRNRVVELREDPDFGMPPDFSNGPIDFTEEDFELIQCWIIQEYPEN